MPPPLVLAALIPRQGTETPSIFAPGGPAARIVAAFGWTTVVISAVVFAVVVLVLAVALVRGRRRTADVRPTHEHHDHPDELRGILLWGLAVPALVLFGTYAYSTVDTARLASPPGPVAETVEVTGKQWWWEMRYRGAGVVTANELHVPVGRPVRLVLHSTDVQHSFWVPRLGPKMDLYPGRTNTTWLQADRPGTYVGECSEFCGPQHAHMGFTVVAQSPAAYAAWVAAQRAPAAPSPVPAPPPLPTVVTFARFPAEPSAADGQRVFQTAGCAYCHAVRGTDAQGQVGPDLTHLASRETIAAGTLRNTRGNLAGWVVNAQSIKPGNRMPNVELSGRDLQAVLAYLETLK